MIGQSWSHVHFLDFCAATIFFAVLIFVSFLVLAVVLLSVVDGDGDGDVGDDDNFLKGMLVWSLKTEARKLKANGFLMAEQQIPE